MNAGILTCHDVYNYGSSLQAYALCSFLKAHGVNPIIIDYKPEYIYRLIDFMEVDSPFWQQNTLRRWAYRLRTLPYKISLLPKFICYKQFNKQHLPITKETYSSVDKLYKIPPVDAIICGSDQIWGSVHNQCGEDPAFFLSFANNTKKIAYAASFGASTVSEAGKKCIKKYLPSFHAISVREKSGVSILRDYGISSEQVCDPVFLLTANTWQSFSKKPKGLPDNYILVYGYDSNIAIDNIAQYYAHTTNYQIIKLQSGSKWGNTGPQEFLWMIANAHLIISSSFHTIAFSIIFQKPFIAIPTNNTPLFERIESLLNQYDLTSQIYSDEAPFPNPNIDFSKTQELLNYSQTQSESFLMEALYGTKTVL